MEETIPEIDENYKLDSVDYQDLFDAHLGYNLTIRKNYLKNLTTRFNKCKWCYNIIYDQWKPFCCEDCSQEYNDWKALNYVMRNKIDQRERYRKLTPEQKKERVRKQVLRKNSGAKKRHCGSNTNINNLTLKTQ